MTDPMEEPLLFLNPAVCSILVPIEAMVTLFLTRVDIFLVIGGNFFGGAYILNSFSWMEVIFLTIRAKEPSIPFVLFNSRISPYLLLLYIIPPTWYTYQNVSLISNLPIYYVKLTYINYKMYSKLAGIYNSSVWFSPFLLKRSSLMFLRRG